MKLVKLLSIIISISYSVQKSSHDWETRSIYQVLTDRIVVDSIPSCPDLKQYCGGTFKDVEKSLPYI